MATTTRRRVLVSGGVGDPAASSNLAGPPAPGRSDLRLVDERGEWCASERLSRHVLSDNADFTVVGVVGTQGSGKSALVGHLAGFPAFGGAIARDPPVSSPPASASSSRTATTTPTSQPQPPFTVGPVDVPFSGGDGPTTRTVNVRVTPDRLVLLDAPPVLSPALFRRRRPNANVATRARDDDARLVRFLADACDVILVVADGPDDLRAANIFAEASSKRWDASNGTETAPSSSSKRWDASNGTETAPSSSSKRWDASNGTETAPSSSSKRWDASNGTETAPSSSSKRSDASNGTETAPSSSSPRLVLVRNRVQGWYRDARDAETRARADAAFRIAADCASESESSRGTRWRVVEVPDANEPDAAEATEEALAAIADAAVSAGAARRAEERGGGAAATERGWLRRAERAWNGARTARERTRTRDERSS